MTKTSGQIKSLHSRIARAVKPLLGYPVTVTRSYGHEGWVKRGKGQNVFFEMVGQDGSLIMDHAITAKGQRRPVLLLPIPSLAVLNPSAWAGWYEEWNSNGDGNFELVGACCTFYWGRWREEKKIQLLRAEWDNHARRGRNAAQPHWHFDREILSVSSFARRDPQETLASQDGQERIPADLEGGLLELDVVSPLQRLSLSGVHLGMAGWEHNGAHPACWQLGMGGRADLVGWAVRCLEHTCSEFCRNLKVEEVD